MFATVNEYAPNRVIVLVEHDHLGIRVDDFEWIGVEVHTRRSGRIATCEYRIVGFGKRKPAGIGIS